MGTLQALHLTGNQFGAAGAASLGAALKTNSTMQTLGLSYSAVGASGAASYAKPL